VESISERRYELDWLRVLVVLLLIPFHTAQIFTPYVYWLRNDQLHIAAHALLNFVDQFHMPLLFSSLEPPHGSPSAGGRGESTCWKG